MELLRTFALFVLTALAEIVGCYLPYLWLKQDRTAWLLLPAAVSLALFPSFAVRSRGGLWFGRHAEFFQPRNSSLVRFDVRITFSRHRIVIFAVSRFAKFSTKSLTAFVIFYDCNQVHD